VCEEGGEELGIGGVCDHVVSVSHGVKFDAMALPALTVCEVGVRERGRDRL
jgi:hypothetical protein